MSNKKPRKAQPSKDTVTDSLDREITILKTLLESKDSAKQYLYSHLTPQHFQDGRLGSFYLSLKALADSRPGSYPDWGVVSVLSQLNQHEATVLVEESDARWKALKSKNAIVHAVEAMEFHAKVAKSARITGKFFDDMKEAIDNGDTDAQTEFMAALAEDITDLDVKAAELSKPEQVRSLLTKSFDGKLSFEAVREKIKISQKELTQIAAREESKKEPAFLRETTPNGKFTRYLTATKGLQMVSFMEHGSAVESRPDAAHLPSDLSQWLTTSGYLDQHAQLVIVAPTDGFKSTILTSAALENAEKGKKVLYINQESDTPRTHKVWATHITGARVNDVDKANNIVLATKWLRNVSLMQIRTQVDLNELCRSMKAMKFDVVIWDYWATHFLGVDTPKQSSAPATIVDRIGVELTDSGIPVIAAVQGRMNYEANKLKADFPLTWLHRATLALVFVEAERAGEGNPFHKVLFEIHKNKHSPKKGFIELLIDADTMTIDRSKFVSWRDFRRSKAAEKAEESERVKEAKAKKAQEKKAKDAAEKTAAAQKKRLDKISAKGLSKAKLPWKPDDDAIAEQAAASGETL